MADIIEIKDDKGKKIKVEVNKFFDQMVSALKKNPKKITALSEQLEEALEEIKKDQEENRPKLGESFSDLFGRRYTVVGKRLNEKVLLRRGNKQYEVAIKELYSKNGEKKNIPTEIIEDDTVVELKF